MRSILNLIGQYAKHALGWEIKCIKQKKKKIIELKFLKMLNNKSDAILFKYYFIIILIFI